MDESGMIYINNAILERINVKGVETVRTHRFGLVNPRTEANDASRIES